MMGAVAIGNAMAGFTTRGAGAIKPAKTPTLAIASRQPTITKNCKRTHVLIFF